MLLLNFGYIGQLRVFVKGNRAVYDLDTPGTFVPQDNVRMILYNEVVCLNGPFPLQGIVLILKNWFRGVLVVGFPTSLKSQVQG